MATVGVKGLRFDFLSLIYRSYVDSCVTSVAIVYTNLINSSWVLASRLRVAAVGR